MRPENAAAKIIRLAGFTAAGRLPSAQPAACP